MQLQMRCALLLLLKRESEGERRSTTLGALLSKKRERERQCRKKSGKKVCLRRQEGAFDTPLSLPLRTKSISNHRCVLLSRARRCFSFLQEKEADRFLSS